MRLFVDTSGWCAVYDRADQHHGSARVFWSRVQSTGVVLFTSDYVFAETVTLLRARAGFNAAVLFGDTLRASRIVTMVEVDEVVRSEAWDLFKGYQDKTFSFVDCTSFAIMRRVGLHESLTFDRHFGQMGFTVYPG